MAIKVPTAPPNWMRFYERAIEQGAFLPRDVGASEFAARSSFRA